MNTNDYSQMLERLKRSRFRSSFHLGEKERKTIESLGIDKIREHAQDFFEKRIRKKVENDGHQTPWNGHPIFVAQHATATCCRKCINKWYGIDQKKELNNEEVDRLVNIVMAWIKSELFVVGNEGKI